MSKITHDGLTRSDTGCFVVVPSVCQRDKGLYSLLIALVVVKDPQTIDWTQYWNPMIYVDNTAVDPKTTIVRTLLYDVVTWEAFFVERHRLKGTFVENLELFHFPFDTQVTMTRHYRLSSLWML